MIKNVDRGGEEEALNLEGQIQARPDDVPDASAEQGVALSIADQAAGAEPKTRAPPRPSPHGLEQETNAHRDQVLSDAFRSWARLITGTG